MIRNRDVGLRTELVLAGIAVQSRVAADSVVLVTRACIMEEDWREQVWAMAAGTKEEVVSVARGCAYGAHLPAIPGESFQELVAACKREVMLHERSMKPDQVSKAARGGDGAHQGFFQGHRYVCGWGCEQMRKRGRKVRLCSAWRLRAAVAWHCRSAFAAVQVGWDHPVAIERMQRLCMVAVVYDKPSPVLSQAASKHKMSWLGADVAGRRHCRPKH